MQLVVPLASETGGGSAPYIPMLWCQTNLGTHCQTVAVMVSYDSILCGESLQRVSVELIVVHMK